MQESWIALVVSCISLGVTVASGLLPVKEWLRYCFLWLWAPSDRNNTRGPANIQLDDMANTDSTGNAAEDIASLGYRVRQLEAALEAAQAAQGLLKRVQTLNSSASSGSDGGRPVERTG
ncbi:hypothetical protein N7530_011171 [Penicillium desertorum]|jgi:hypothetical protein|uniref:Uncharacterized protein n=1 Tax=Penicillium desertorum TaxID=1303715 RepID=A0A9W9WGQ8_9EURO|nr:hypothetical protein N7530_011171 [Penicillium desertorum]